MHSQAYKYLPCDSLIKFVVKFHSWTCEFQWIGHTAAQLKAPNKSSDSDYFTPNVCIEIHAKTCQWWIKDFPSETTQNNLQTTELIPISPRFSEVRNEQGEIDSLDFFSTETSFITISLAQLCRHNSWCKNGNVKLNSILIEVQAYLEELP